MYYNPRLKTCFLHLPVHTSSQHTQTENPEDDKDLYNAEESAQERGSDNK